MKNPEHRNHKLAMIVTVATVFIILTPVAEASVFTDIQNGVAQVLSRIFSITLLPSEKPELKKEGNAENIPPAAEKKETAVGPGGALYTIMGGDSFPAFKKELVVDPANSEIGKPQMFSIWVNDPSGVAAVKAIIHTDGEDKQVVFSLEDGNEKMGRWGGSWNAEDMQAGQYYKIIFQAVGKGGGKAEMPFLAKAKTK